MHINITDSENGGNRGSSSQLVHYLEKENRVAIKSGSSREPEYWFNHSSSDIQAYEARIALDNNIAKLSKTDAKFFLINVSPSRKELTFLKEKFGENTLKARLKEFTVSVMDEYAGNFKRPGIESAKDLLWFAKVEEHRYYSHKDPEVRQGLKKRGELKDGDQWHIQIIVSRKDMTNSIKLSPMNKSRGRNHKHSQKVGQFDRKAFAESGERLFDQKFGFDRGLDETFRYTNTMKNGTIEQKLDMLRGKGLKDVGLERQGRDLIPADPYEHPELKVTLLDSLLLRTDQDYSIAHFKRKKRKKRDRGMHL